MEKTLVLVKNDGVKRALIGSVISRFENAGLKVSAIKMIVPTKELVGKHYADDEKWLFSVGTKAKKAYESKGQKPDGTELDLGRRIRNRLINFLSDGPVVAIVIEGNEAIFSVRKIVGTTEPKSADPSSIRGIYSSDSYDLADSRDRPIKNIVHASEDKKSADLEIALWFDNNEIYEYDRSDIDAVY